MIQSSTALIAVNNSLLLSNQVLFQGFTSLGIQIRNKSSINTKEGFLIELEVCKPSFAFLSSGLAGVIGLTEVLIKSKDLSPNTKIILFVSENDKGRILSYYSSNADAIIWSDNIQGNLDQAFKQLKQNLPYMCGKSLIDMRSKLVEQSSLGQSEVALLSHLTGREQEVLFALTKGINYKQISKQLYISESTVKTHVNNIFTKLNVNDRTQAVLYALNHGIDRLVKKPDLLKDILNVSVNQ